MIFRLSSLVIKVLRSFELGLGCNNSEGVEKDGRRKESKVDLGLDGKVTLVTLASEKAYFINGSNYRVDGGSVGSV
jgi:hypothetical protein